MSRQFVWEDANQEEETANNFGRRSATRGLRKPTVTEFGKFASPSLRAVEEVAHREPVQFQSL